MTESDKKVIDSLEKLAEFLSEYKKLTPEEQANLSQVIGNITVNTTGMAIMINAINNAMRLK